MGKDFDIAQLTDFEWDRGNKIKNVVKHEVENEECEEIFFNNPIFLPDRTHSQVEERYHAFGITNTKRLLLIAFTLRYNKIRVISARDQNAKEKAYYYQYRNEEK